MDNNDDDDEKYASFDKDEKHVGVGEADVDVDEVDGKEIVVSGNEIVYY